MSSITYHYTLPEHRVKEAFQSKLFLKVPNSAMRYVFQAALRSNVYPDMVVAKDGERPVGALLIMRDVQFKKGELVSDPKAMVMVYVKHRYRRRNIGRHLVLFALDRHGLDRNQVCCGLGPDGAQAFFSAHGIYRPFKEIPDEAHSTTLPSEIRVLSQYGEHLLSRT